MSSSTSAQRCFLRVPVHSVGFSRVRGERRISRFLGLVLYGGPMSLLELKPRTAQSNGAARLSQEVANSNVKAKPDNYLSGATEPPLPLTPQRLELILAYANKPLRHAEGATASRIAQRFAPRPPAKPSAGDPQFADPAPLAAPFSALTSGIRRLTAVLVVAALLPNLTLAAFWLAPSTCLGRSPPRLRPTPAQPRLRPRLRFPFFPRRVRSRRPPASMSASPLRSTAPMPCRQAASSSSGACRKGADCPLDSAMARWNGP